MPLPVGAWGALRALRPAFKGHVMSCEICNRGACTRSFHSISEQEEFDTKTGRYAPEPETVVEADDMCDGDLEQSG